MRSKVFAITEPGRIEESERDANTEEGQTLIRPVFTGICKSDINYFEGLLGNPVFVNYSEYNGFKEFIFVNEFFYTQAITNDSGRVLAYSITTRKEDFNPEIELGPYTTENKIIKVKLGKTKFYEIDGVSFGDPESIDSRLGVHDWFYSEEHYFGNPGNYQSYFFSVNQAGYGNEFYPPAIKDQRDNTVKNPEIIDFRKNAIINTYTITVPMVNSKTLGLSNNENYLLGPDYNQVRVLR